MTDRRGWVASTLSVNFGLASLIGAAVTLYHPDWSAQDWQLLLIFYGVLLMAFLICTFGNKWLPHADTCCAAFTLITIVVCLIALSVKASVGRHSASYALGHYDKSFAGYGGFTWYVVPSSLLERSLCSLCCTDIWLRGVAQVYWPFTFGLYVQRGRDVHEHG